MSDGEGERGSEGANAEHGERGEGGLRTDLVPGECRRGDRGVPWVHPRRVLPPAPGLRLSASALASWSSVGVPGAGGGPPGVDTLDDGALVAAPLVSAAVSSAVAFPGVAPWVSAAAFLVAVSLATFWDPVSNLWFVPWRLGLASTRQSISRRSVGPVFALCSIFRQSAGLALDLLRRSRLFMLVIGQRRSCCPGPGDCIRLLGAGIGDRSLP